jgi:hypothetical protein
MSSTFPADVLLGYSLASSLFLHVYKEHDYNDSSSLVCFACLDCLQRFPLNFSPYILFPCHIITLSPLYIHLLQWFPLYHLSKSHHAIKIKIALQLTQLLVLCSVARQPMERDDDVHGSALGDNSEVGSASRTRTRLPVQALSSGHTVHCSTPRARRATVAVAVLSSSARRHMACGTRTPRSSSTSSQVPATAINCTEHVPTATGSDSLSAPAAAAQAQRRSARSGADFLRPRAHRPASGAGS